MTDRFTSRLRSIFRASTFLFALLLTLSALADTWHLQVGAQNGDMSHQALAFLPNEIWIHATDTVTFTFPATEIHTVTFLTSTQARPNRLVGCPGVPNGVTPDFSLFDGTACVNSGLLTNASASTTYSVVFPKTGNFKLVCLAHTNMTATVHVMDQSAPLPHDQDFYDDQAEHQRTKLLSDPILSGHHHVGSHAVTAGVGQIFGTGGGTQTASLMRFADETNVIHAGETVEWTTSEAVTSHTITFGPEPDPSNQVPPSANVTLDPDGARHAYISSSSDVVHSGFITQPPQDRQGLAQTPLSATRFRVTFTQPGVYQYKCVLHDQIGMVGQVIVLP